MRRLAERLGLRPAVELNLAEAKRAKELELRALGYSRAQARRAVAQTYSASQDKDGK
jgi:Holliday junction resolvasome RuvABC DNA-binding subunit